MKQQQTVTIVDVAKLAGVSPATAGRVVGGYSNVSEKNKKKVLDAVAALQYTPNRMAQGLKGGRTRTMAVVLKSIRNDYCNRLIYAVEKEAERHGWSVIVCNSHGQPEKEAEILRDMRGRQVDGVVLLPSVDAVAGIAPEDLDLYQGDMPVIQVDTRIEGLDVGLIETDNTRSAHAATRYLLELGHRRIGVMSPPECSTVRDRISGYRKALKEQGVAFDESLVTTVPEEERTVIRAKAARLLDMARPTAILSLNNCLTAPTLMELRERGIQIPKDMSFIGWDGEDLTELEEITAISQPVEDVGKMAVERLMHLIEHPETPRSPYPTVLRTSMVLRRSCRPPLALQ